MDLPESPDELLKMLFEIFPDYRKEYELRGPFHDYTPSFHSVLLGFRPFFGTYSETFSERQVDCFRKLINQALSQPGPLENAFDTCFLEALDKRTRRKLLRGPKNVRK